jgi:hypothetical protein
VHTLIPDSVGTWTVVFYSPPSGIVATIATAQSLSAAKALVAYLNGGTAP